MQNLKRNDTNELTYKTVTDQVGEGWRERLGREFGMDRYTLLYLKWLTVQVLLDSTWKSAQCYVAAWMGEEFRGRMNTCICMPKFLCCPPKTNTSLLIGYIPM